MAGPMVIGLLNKKKSELLGDLEHHKSLINQIQEDLNTINKTILIYDPTYDLGGIKPVNKYYHNRQFKRGELKKLIIEFLKASDKPVTTVEIEKEIQKDRELTTKIRNSIKVTCYNLKQKGLIKVVASEDNTALWVLPD